MSGLQMQFGVANPLLFLDDIHLLEGSFYDEPMVLPTSITPPFAPTTPSTTTTTTTMANKMPLTFPLILSNDIPLLPPLPNYQIPQVNHLPPPSKKRALNGGGVASYYPKQQQQQKVAVLPRPPTHHNTMAKVPSSQWSSPSPSPTNNNTQYNTESSSSSSTTSDVLEEQRKERNRKHAKKSRQRRKSLTEDLQQSLNSLKAENSKLRQVLYTQLGTDQRPRIDSMVESKVSQPTDEFIEEVKDFRKYALDNKTRTFLRTLSKTATKCADEFRNNNALLLLDEEEEEDSS